LKRDSSRGAGRIPDDWVVKRWVHFDRGRPVPQGSNKKKGGGKKAVGRVKNLHPTRMKRSIGEM